MIPRRSPTQIVNKIAAAGSKTAVQHVGLAHEKLAPHPSLADKDAQSRFIRNLSQHSQASLGYPLHFRRYVRRTPRVSTGPWQRRVGVVVSQGRVLCGMGELTPTENGLSVHQTHGVPVLPGSSLKGITRAWICENLPEAQRNDPQAWFLQAFGREPAEDDKEDSGESGQVHFLDALWIPGDSRLPNQPWAAEILTPHFGDYYSGKAAPDGTQSPIPVTFLAAQGGFRVVLEGPDKLVDLVLAWMYDALLRRGVGAKGRSGYGRFTNWQDRATRADEQEQAAIQDREATRARQADFDGASDAVAMLRAICTHEAKTANKRALVSNWLLGTPRVDARLRRFSVNPDTATAVYLWARDHNVTKGLLKSLPPALADGIRTRLPGGPGGSTAQGGPGGPGPRSHTGFGSAHLDSFEDPGTLKGKKKKTWPDRFAKKIEAGDYDEDTVRRAVDHLKAHNARPGHLKGLLARYGLSDT